MTKKYFYLILSTVILLLAGCHQKPKALVGAYYASLSPELDKHIQLLVFSSKHPESVAFEEIYRWNKTYGSYGSVKKMARIYPVKYDGNKVFITISAGETYPLLISTDKRILNCTGDGCQKFGKEFKRDKGRNEKNSNTIYEKILANTNELQYR